ncbi:uncharacterized protein LOC134817300 isoform X2 [Bolinopsis microptera]|uniref:uncharacterized protein LOC134817300 isoform X2 n=1 Tax=Bolinopsis microptera TaxID=2820187 RepID=UPI00307AF2B8
MEGDEVEKRNNSSGSGPGRRSLASAVSTESGIHMGSDHDTITLNTAGGDQLIMQTKKLTKMIKNVRRSHSYNVCDANKTNLKHRRAVRPKSLVHGWEESSISVEELYLWQSQLKQLHLLNKQTSDLHIAKSKAMTKVPKKESLREKAKTLIRGLKTKRALKNKGSMSSSCTEDDPDSTSSSLDRSGASITQNISWTSKDASDLLRILKVFAGPGLHTNSNAEYRSVLATIDSTVLEIKKQSISKYGFVDINPMSYTLICSTGFYTDSKGNDISTLSEGFGSKSECWKEVHAEHLTDTSRPLDLQTISEEMESTRLELRYKTPSSSDSTPSPTSPASPMDSKQETIKQETIKQATGLHHHPDKPFLILIQAFDRELDHVIYPLSEGETRFISLGTPPQPSYTGSVIVIHTNETVERSIMLSGPKCMLCNGSKKTDLKCGQSFDIGKHYKFIFKEAIDNDVPSPEIGSPDTQRTLSTGTLTSLSPELNNMSTIIHQHAEPRFIFYMEHRQVLLDSILDYDTLCNKNVLACARLTIMSLRHAFEHFTPAEMTELLEYSRDRIELLAKVVQQKAAELLNTCNPNQKKSATSFLKPMVKLLSSTLEIVHYLRENPLLTDDKIVNEIEKLAVPMYEHIAYHSAKMVYELLPSILDPVPLLPPSKPSTEVPSDGVPVSTSGSCQDAPVSSSVLSSVEEDAPVKEEIPSSPPPTEREKRRWSVPYLAPTRKRKMTKDRPRSESLTGTERQLLGATRSSPAGGASLSADEITDIIMQNAVKFSGNPNSPGCRRNTARQNLTNIGPGVKVLVQLLQKFHTLSNNCKLNSAMVKQLFVSIFYFSNTTLFNTIIESPQLYFNWNKGIQMRIHLDYVLRWTHHVQLSHTSNMYFRELHQLLDLLSLPKRDLLASTWAALSKTFPNLSPAQLNHVLSNHSVSQKPRIWKPCPPLSLTTDSSIRIELTSYPQLVIPNRGYKLANFSEIPDNLRPTLAKLTKSIVSMSQTKRSPVQANTLQANTFKCSLQKNDSKSIGLKLKKNSQGNIRVSDIVLNSPAQLSGEIECEDEILQINNTPVSGNSVAFCKRIIMNSEDNVQLLLGRTKL